MEKKYKDWQFALGLNEIDEVTPSYFLQSLIEANIIGMISDSQAETLLQKYLIENNLQSEYKHDLVTLRIKRLLAIKDFKLNQNYLLAIHRYVFDGILPSAGQIRKTNLSRKEKCLNGETVIYATTNEIQENLDYDFYYENQKLAKRKTDLMLPSFCKFLSNVWQTHPFSDGNTRTLSVFTQKYLNYLGYATDNDVFKYNSVYFRNALVRSNPTTNESLLPTNEYLLKFLDKLLFHPEITLDNAEMNISPTRN